MFLSDVHLRLHLREHALALLLMALQLVLQVIRRLLLALLMFDFLPHEAVHVHLVLLRDLLFQVFHKLP